MSFSFSEFDVLLRIPFHQQNISTIKISYNIVEKCSIKCNE